MDIIAMALKVGEAVGAFVAKARRFFYEVMLSDHACPSCGGRLLMVGESRRRCASCGHTLDPTVVFQRCTGCGGRPVLRMRRYCCGKCGSDIASRFVFDGLVFNAEYFREKMAESRERKRERREEIRRILAESRSASAAPCATDLGSVPGLVAALDGLTVGVPASFCTALRPSFDLRRYERHLRAYLGSLPTRFDDIPPLEQDRRQDRIWRFVALVLMTQTGPIDIWQQGEAIMVSQHEAN